MFRKIFQHQWNIIKWKCWYIVNKTRKWNSCGPWTQGARCLLANTSRAVQHVGQCWVKKKTHHHCIEPQTSWFCSAWRRLKIRKANNEHNYPNATATMTLRHCCQRQVNVCCSPAELWTGRPGCWLWRKETPRSCSHTSIHRSGCRCQTLCGAEQQWEWRDWLY